jgi:hypothetical protein
VWWSFQTTELCGLAVLIGFFAIDDCGEISNGAGAPTPNHFYAMSSISFHNVSLKSSSTGSHRTGLLAISLQSVRGFMRFARCVVSREVVLRGINRFAGGLSSVMRWWWKESSLLYVSREVL